MLELRVSGTIVMRPINIAKIKIRGFKVTKVFVEKIASKQFNNVGKF